MKMLKLAIIRWALRQVRKELSSLYGSDFERLQRWGISDMSKNPQTGEFFICLDDGEE